jgi:hypothetical protein
MYNAHPFNIQQYNMNVKNTPNPNPLSDMTAAGQHFLLLLSTLTQQPTTTFIIIAMLLLLPLPPLFRDEIFISLRCLFR